MDLVEIGYVSRAHGIRGELRVALHNRESDCLRALTRLYIDGVAHEIRKVRPNKDVYLVELVGVDDRNRAEELRGRPISADRQELSLDEDELLLADFVGLTVDLAGGGTWGTVVAVQVGPQDRLVVRDTEHERLLPVVDELIVEVDLEARRMVIDPPDDWPTTPVRG